MSENAMNWQEKKCPICGKEFIVTSEWAYKRGSTNKEHVFCSYSCLRKYDKAKCRTKAETREMIIQAIHDGLTTNEICMLLGTDPDRVWYWRRKLKREEKEDERETGSEETDGVYCGP